MVYKDYKMGAYNIYTIKTDKFKICRMEIIFRNNVVKEDVTIRNVLFDILCESSKSYPTRRNLLLKLEELYNSNLYSVTSKVGHGAIANICLDFINPKYSDKKILKETLKLPFEMLFNPLVNNKEFDEKTLNIIKERLSSDIKAIKESPKKYAFIEALKNLHSDSPTSFDNIGSLDALENITPSSLYKYYEKVLKHDYVDIYIIGDLDMDEVANIIGEHAKFKTIKTHETKLYAENRKMKTKVIKDKFIYVQTNIIAVLNLNKLTPFERNYVASLYNMILGGGALETKLATRLRTENSLCYHASSAYQKYDGLIIINTSVDINAKDKAIKLIKQAIKDMQNNVKEEELATSKELILSGLSMGIDSIVRLVDNYFYRNIGDLDDFETRIKEFKKVTLSDIQNLNKKISMSIIYALEGGEANEEN